MDCCRSSLRAGTHPEMKPQGRAPAAPPPSRQSFSLSSHQAAPPPSSSSSSCAGDFAEYSLADLRAAMGGFAAENIVSESSDKVPNFVYRGRLPSTRRAITVKKFAKMAWPNPKQFAEEARGVGRLRHRCSANLIGYCCDGDERLLVAEFMPNDTLAKHLFHSTFLGEEDFFCGGSMFMEAMLVGSRGDMAVAQAPLVLLESTFCDFEHAPLIYEEHLLNSWMEKYEHDEDHWLNSWMEKYEHRLNTEVCAPPRAWPPACRFNKLQIKNGSSSVDLGAKTGKGSAALPATNLLLRHRHRPRQPPMTRTSASLQHVCYAPSGMYWAPFVIYKRH